MAKIVQTAGRNVLGEFAPQFAYFNDDVLFGENWNNEDIDVKTRSIITVVALMSQGITDSSLKFHLQNAKDHGVTQKEIVAIITHVGFYAGWPKAWAVFNLAKEVWEVNEGDLPYEDEAMRAHAKSMVFPIGEPNDGFAQYFVGNSYLAPVSLTVLFFVQNAKQLIPKSKAQIGKAVIQLPVIKGRVFRKTDREL